MRMGRDKAAILVEGIPLWRRQLARLAQTAAEEIFISGHPTGPWMGEKLEVVPDVRAGEGPLGALSALLHRCTSEWLLVVAVDMPAMTPEYLRHLAAEAERTGRAIVPRQMDGGWEPLAAVYPRRAAAWVEKLLLGGARKMEAIIRLLEDQDLLSIRPVAEAERGLFVNWNEPSDLPAW